MAGRLRATPGRPGDVRDVSRGVTTSTDLTGSSGPVAPRVVGPHDSQGHRGGGSCGLGVSSGLVCDGLRRDVLRRLSIRRCLSIGSGFVGSSFVGSSFVGSIFGRGGAVTCDWGWRLEIGRRSIHRTTASGQDGDGRDYSSSRQRISRSPDTFHRSDTERPISATRRLLRSRTAPKATSNFRRCRYHRGLLEETVTKPLGRAALFRPSLHTGGRFLCRGQPRPARLRRPSTRGPSAVSYTHLTLPTKRIV